MKKNDASLSKGKGSSCSSENTNMHKLMAMGQTPKTQVSGGKKTPA